MNRSRIVSLLLPLPVLLAAGLPAGTARADPATVIERGDHDPVTGLTTPQRQELLAAHNRWRTQVGVQALVWSEALAASAAQWAAQLGRGYSCAMEHSDRPEVGENLYWASAITWSDGRVSMQDVTPSFVVDVWGRESADYQPATNTCRPGKVCGHYTQLVWRGTRQVGCALRVCGAKDQVWICQYQPAGNYIGQRPY
jgi:pathogenesis-related protein 1